MSVSGPCPVGQSGPNPSGQGPVGRFGSGSPGQAPVIRPCRDQDLDRVTEIYNQAVLDGGSTADIEPVSRDARRVWFLDHRPEQGHPVLVVQIDGVVQAFGSLSPYYDRPGYAATCELGYYVDRSARGRGLATVLVEALLDRAREAGMKKAVAIIFDDNVGTRAVLGHFGFACFGLLPQGASDRYGPHDVSYWVLSL